MFPMGGIFFLKNFDLGILKTQGGVQFKKKIQNFKKLLGIIKNKKNRITFLKYALFLDAK